VDFLFVLIELFSVGVMAEVLRANIYWKSAFLKGWVSFSQIFTQKWTSPTNHFCRIDMTVNALQLCRWSYSHKETL